MADSDLREKRRVFFSEMERRLKMLRSGKRIVFSEERAGLSQALLAKNLIK